MLCENMTIRPSSLGRIKTTRFSILTRLARPTLPPVENQPLFKDCITSCISAIGNSERDIANRHIGRISHFDLAEASRVATC